MCVDMYVCHACMHSRHGRVGEARVRGTGVPRTRDLWTLDSHERERLSSDGVIRCIAMRDDAKIDFFADSS